MPRSERITVVLPAPRQPVSTVTGTMLGGSAAAACSSDAATAARLCPAASVFGAPCTSASCSRSSLGPSDSRSCVSEAASAARSTSTSAMLSLTLVTVLPSAASCLSRPKLVPAVAARDLPSRRSRVDATTASEELATSSSSTVFSTGVREIASRKSGSPGSHGQSM